MSFAFSYRKRVEAQVHAVAGDQIEKALSDIAEAGADVGKTVHSLRRRCKRLRGLVRLLGGRFEGAARENAAFRDAAASLSQARDAAVMGDTFASLLAFDRKRGDAAVGTEEAAEIGAALAARAQAPAASGDDPFAQFRAIFEDAARRVPHWSVEGRGFDGLAAGLASNYRQFRKRLVQAQDEPSAVHLHDWRKVVKYHGHHVTLLRRAAPDLLKGRQAAVDGLGDRLGDHHNLAVLQDNLGQLGMDGAVMKVIAEQQDELTAAAFALGRQLAAEGPDALRRRFEGYWSLLPEKP